MTESIKGMRKINTGISVSSSDNPNRQYLSKVLLRAGELSQESVPHKCITLYVVIPDEIKMIHRWFYYCNIVCYSHKGLRA